jgi:acetylornithine deacetylase
MSQKISNVSEILNELIAFPVLGGESNLSIIHWIKNYISDFDIDAQLVYSKDKMKASLHCRIGPAVDGGIILSGHTDVVPVEGQDWKTPPFELTDGNDGKLYGRGTCDMKGFVACCLSLLPSLTKANLVKPIYFAFSYDEEIGCLAAPELILHLQKYYKETPKFAIIGEPSMMQTIIGHKGICLYDTYVNGSAGHSSGILKEVSAIHESARLIIWLEEKMKSYVTAGHLDHRFTPPHSSIHVGKINSGIAANVIADKAHFSWDARVIPKDSLPEIIEDFKTYCGERERELQTRFPSFKITTIEQHPPVPPLDTNNDAEIVKILQEINNNHTIGTVAYAAEAGQFSEAGIQSIICGPGSIDQAHRANEYIDKTELDLCISMLTKLIQLNSD